MSLPSRRVKLRLHVRSSAATSGFLQLGQLRVRCVVGRGGIRARKREGDGATPSGRWRLVEVLWRQDRCRRPICQLPVRAIRPDDGWCDAPMDRNYNRPVRHPYPAGAEHLYRSDCLYDVVVALDHNARPRVRGRGSAIFIHVARPDWMPTEGCIAMKERDLRLLLSCVGRCALVAIDC
ncbi:MAG: L,D-transpeptidase [Hyphomicrobiaceae bacterium]